ncbi:MAG: 16S rRNA (cytosine(1402)-N(4))-methyltransferase RsmH [Anaerolineae bacterium]|nr:16S rRNA (cytosine(1402)-N(4))-methyltransferase RsmH [Anaerolineae bacterium]
METMNPPHLPVLFEETMTALQPKPGGRYIDCTLGAGGHALGILQRTEPDGLLLGFDLDASAIEIARGRLSDFGQRVVLRHASYLEMHAVLQELGWNHVDGIVIDFGVSSMQLDQPQRGFSFREDGLLDMRFDPSRGTSAADWLKTIMEDELADVLWKYGEERASRRIAAAIVTARSHAPIQTTHQLADIIQNTVGRKKERGRRPIHPATRSFQAIRIAVNHELQSVEAVLPLAVQALKPGGRLAVISFHSLEDRIVKDYFHTESRDCICPPHQPVCTCNHTAILHRITHKPITAADAENQENPRARSAKLRVVEKMLADNGINHA